MKKNISQAVSPFLHIFRICGMCPYSINNIDYNFFLKKHDVFLLIWQILVFFMYAIHYKFVYFHQYSSSDYSIVEKITFSFYTNSVIINSFLNLLLLDFKHNKITIIFNLSRLIENSLNKFNIHSNYDKIFKYGLKVLIIFIIFDLYLIMITVVGYNEIYFFVTYFLILSNGDVIICFLHTILHDVESKFKLINNYISSIINEDVFDVNNKIQELIGIHKKLHRVCCEINSLFNLNLCGIFVISVTTIVQPVFYLIAGKTYNYTSFFHVFIVVSWNIYIIIKIIYLVHHFNAVTFQVFFVIFINLTKITEKKF